MASTRATSRFSSCSSSLNGCISDLGASSSSSSCAGSFAKRVGHLVDMPQFERPLRFPASTRRRGVDAPSKSSNQARGSGAQRQRGGWLAQRFWLLYRLGRASLAERELGHLHTSRREQQMRNLLLAFSVLANTNPIPILCRSIDPDGAIHARTTSWHCFWALTRVERAAGHD